MTHPLTDEICEEICRNGDPFKSHNEIWFDSMRAAYDLGESKGRADMLEQVIHCLGEYETIGLEEHDLVVRLIHDLKEAMRPQEDN